MKPAGVALVALVTSAGALLWFSGLSEASPVKQMLALILFAFLYRLVPELLPPSWPKSTMGQRSDGLIGFEAQVDAIEPLRVEAQGSIWQARLLGGGSVQVGTRVQVVDREGLTLLVQAGGTNRETA